MNSTQLTPVAWQKFGEEYCLTGQFAMRPIFLSVGGRLGRKPSLRLLTEGLLVPFDPEHPHARRIVDSWNQFDEFSETDRQRANRAEEALREIAILCGMPDPSDSEGVTPEEIKDTVEAALTRLVKQAAP